MILNLESAGLTHLESEITCCDQHDGQVNASESDSDEGLTLEASVFESLTVANLLIDLVLDNF